MIKQIRYYHESNYSQSISVSFAITNNYHTRSFERIKQKYSRASLFTTRNNEWMEGIVTHRIVPL